MISKLKYILCGMAIFILFPIIESKSDEEISLKLTLNDCIERALVENVSFQYTTLGIKLENQNIIQQTSVYDPSLSIGITRNKSVSPNYTSYIPVSDVESNNTDFTLDLSRKLSTGATLGIGYSAFLSESNVETQKNYSGNAGITFSQPLLKGFGKNVTESGLYIARVTEK